MAIAVPRVRLASVDALRGLALAGMLVVHVQYYAEGPPVWDERVQWIVDTLFVARFWGLFSFLFGVGFALQMERWGDRPGFAAVYLRRLVVLALFAVALVAFTGYHVLLTYAFWGLALLAMRRWSARALLIAAIVIAFAGPASRAIRWQLETRTIGLAASNARVLHERETRRTLHEEEQRLTEHGPYAQLMAHRLRSELRPYGTAQHYVPGAYLLMFVLGLWTVKKGILQEPHPHRRLLAVVVVTGVILSQASDHVPLGWMESVSRESLRLQSAWRDLMLWTFMNPMYQGLAYGAALLLWMAHAVRVPALCRWLSHAGRMSLTNYIVQVCLLELIFRGAGFTITRPAGLLAAAVLFVIQVVYSYWWFTRYRIGPVEWLWRTLSYGRRQPLARGETPTIS